MIKSKRFLPVLIISIIVIVCTTLVFGMSSNAKELIDWMAFLFIIIAEVICMLGIMFAGGERKAKALLNAGTITTLVEHKTVCSGCGANTVLQGSGPQYCEYCGNKLS